jgi:hypothetical protein
MGLIRLMRYKLAKRQARLRQKLHPNYVPTEKEEMTIKIITALIQDKDSVMMVAPNSGKLYIKHLEKAMFIIIDDKYITLLNSKTNSYHDILVHYQVADKLKRHFKNVLESRQNTMENDMLDGVIHSLDYIAKNLNEPVYGDEREHREQRTKIATTA